MCLPLFCTIFPFLELIVLVETRNDQFHIRKGKEDYRKALVDVRGSRNMNSYQNDGFSPSTFMSSPCCAIGPPFLMILS